MPFYVYTTKDGESVERMQPMDARHPKKITLPDGRVAHRDFAAEQGGQSFKTPRMADPWPLLSDAAGCHPSQIGTFKKLFRKNGLQVDYSPDGRPEFKNNSHRNACMKVLGLCDLDAGYGQYAGR